jgi:hypothetical protein
VEESDAETTFLFQNSSTKPISAFSFAFDDSTTHTVDFLEADNALLPKATCPFVTVNTNLRESDHVVRLLAVVFTDASSDGAQSALDWIHAKRLGRILEAERVGRLLDSAGQGVDDASIATLLAKIGTLPTSAEQAASSLAGC